MTYADLKRDAKSGKLTAELVERFGSSAIIERLRGIRPIVDANSVGIKFRNADGSISECRIERAKLCEYTGDELIVYNYGLRDLTPEEQVVMDQWKAVTETERYKRQSEIDALSDGSSTYWQGVAFFEKCNMAYLYRDDMDKYHKKFDYRTGRVWDKNVRGDVVLRYKVYRASA